MPAEETHLELAAYALDVLDADEERAFERHLDECEGCRAELPELRNAAAALAWDVDAPRLLPALDPPSRAGAALLRRRVRTVLATAAAVAAVVWTVAYTHTGGAGARTIPLAGAAGSLVVQRDGKARLVVFELPRPAPSSIYEAWIIERGRAEPAGLFRTGRVSLTMPVRRGALVAVTLEQVAGVAKLTGPILFRARVS